MRRTPASRFARRAWVAAALAVTLVAACGSSSSTSSTSRNTSPESTSGGSSATPAKLTASARGVTADTIKIGFVYPDLEALAKTGFVKVSHGPYDKIVRALVDDINAHGGVLGRKLEVFPAKYSVFGNADQTTACTKLTEDDKVFAVLGGLVGTNNLCIVQQHQTLLVQTIGSSLNASMLAKAQAPFVTSGASDERNMKATVQLLTQQGRLKGKKIAVYAVGDGKPLMDLMTKTLTDAGFAPKDSALNNAPGTDTEALNAQDKVIATRFNDEHIDTVFVVNTVPPGAVFDTAGFHPTIYSPVSLITAGAFTNPYGKFPLVAGVEASADPDAGYNSPSMQHCRAVWKQASGQDVQPASVELKEGKSSGFTGVENACAALDIFVAAAKAAGPDLTYATWQKAVESLHSIDLPTTPAASFGPNKPDAQDSFQLAQYNPAWKPATNAPQTLPLGQAITMTS